MFNFFRPKPKHTRMSHPLWSYYFEELRKEGKPTDDNSVMNYILLSFAFQSVEKGEAMCRDGYRDYGRGAIIHVPNVPNWIGIKKFPSTQAYVPKTQLADLLLQHLGEHIVEALTQDMESYDPDREYITAVWLTFDNKEPTPFDMISWLPIPYTPYYASNTAGKPAY